MACKHGALKNPIGRRQCKKPPRHAKKTKRAKKARRGPKGCKKISFVNCRPYGLTGKHEVCDVKITGEKTRTMSSSKVGPFIGPIVARLTRIGCKPKVKGLLW